MAAEYALKVSGDSPVQSTIDVKVDPGETERVAVTVGPVQQAENTVMLYALRLRFGLGDGNTVETEPVIIETTKAIVEDLISESAKADPAAENVAQFCPREIANIDDVLGEGSVVAEPVKQLREAYQRLT